MRTIWTVTAWLATPILLSACASTTTAPSTSTASRTTTSAPTAAALPPPTPAVRTVNWFDLDVGDCLAEPPPVDDPNVVAVAVVDCATPHRAEVYLRTPLAVNTAGGGPLTVPARR